MLAVVGAGSPLFVVRVSPLKSRYCAGRGRKRSSRPLCGSDSPRHPPPSAARWTTDHGAPCMADWVATVRVPAGRREGAIRHIDGLLLHAHIVDIFYNPRFQDELLFAVEHQLPLPCVSRSSGAGGGYYCVCFQRRGPEVEEVWSGRQPRHTCNNIFRTEVAEQIYLGTKESEHCFIQRSHYSPGTLPAP